MGIRGGGVRVEGGLCVPPMMSLQTPIVGRFLDYGFLFKPALHSQLYYDKKVQDLITNCQSVHNQSDQNQRDQNQSDQNKNDQHHINQIKTSTNLCRRLRSGL